jgi:hypothetical protein
MRSGSCVTTTDDASRKSERPVLITPVPRHAASLTTYGAQFSFDHLLPDLWIGIFQGQIKSLILLVKSTTSAWLASQKNGSIDKMRI